jgi:hypothetical protein
VGRFVPLCTASGLYKPERWCDTPSPTDVPRVGDKVALPVTPQSAFTTHRRMTALSGTECTSKISMAGDKISITAFAYDLVK